jgi:hypothetical protein
LILCASWDIFNEFIKCDSFQMNVLSVYGCLVVGALSSSNINGKWFMLAMTVRDRRKLPNEELHDLFFSPYIIRVIRSSIIRWVGHVACSREKRNASEILVGI